MTRLWRPLVALGLAGGLAVGTLAGAADAAGEREPFENMLEGISLTDDQEKVVDEIQKEAAADREALAAAHREMVDKLLAELERARPDRTALHAEADEFLELLGNSAHERLDQLLDLYGVLDADQQETFRENVDKHAAKFGSGVENPPAE